MAARYYDPRFGRFASRDPEHTPMSPYAYCLNNPVSFVDPTGHSIGGGCGGCYTAYFSQNYWKLAYYSSMPQLPLISDPSLGFGNGNPTFTDASGGDPFRRWWQDEDRLEAYRMRMEDLWAALERTLTNVIPTGMGTMNFEGNYGSTYTFMGKNSKLGNDKFESLMAGLKFITYLSGLIEGEITVGEKYAPNPNTFDLERQMIKETVTLTDLLRNLTQTPHYLIATFMSVDPRDIAGSNSSLTQFPDYGVILFNQNLSWGTQRALIWNAFMHEILQRYSSFYKSEYIPGYIGPEEEIQPFIRYRPPGW
jgi:hypothetical protein